MKELMHHHLQQISGGNVFLTIVPRKENKCQTLLQCISEEIYNNILFPCQGIEGTKVPKLMAHGKKICLDFAGLHVFQVKDGIYTEQKE